MRINKKKQIEKCVRLKEDVYYQPQTHVWLDVEKQRLVATNGNALAVVPVNCDTQDKTGFITVEAIRYARKQNARKQDIQIIAKDRLEILKGPLFPRPTVDEIGTYPTWLKVIPKKSETDLVIGINPKLLLAVANALGTEQVALHFRRTKENKRDAINKIEPIIVTSLDTDAEESIGVIMPVRIPPK
jgi:hypothetical protein